MRTILSVLALLAMFAVPVRAQPVRADVAERQRQCAGKDGWSDPAPPVRIFGNTYDVGTCGITVLLVTGPAGHVLIDGATAAAAPLILANIRALGLRARDVQLLLNSHSHFDHAGGLAALQRATGARVATSAAGRAVLATGRPAADDPQAADLTPIARVRVARVVDDGETLAVGPLRILAHTTPGHAPDGMSWSWTSCEAATCHRMVFADSLSAISADGYRFTDHPDYVARLRGSIGRIAGLPCDILLTPHPGSSDVDERLAGKMSLVDRGGCAAHAAEARARLDSRLLRERAGAPNAVSSTRASTAPFCLGSFRNPGFHLRVLSPGIRFRISPRPGQIVAMGARNYVWPTSSIWRKFAEALCDRSRLLPEGTKAPLFPQIVLFAVGQPDGPYVTMEYPDAGDPLAPVFTTLGGRALLMPQTIVRDLLDHSFTMPDHPAPPGD